MGHQKSTSDERPTATVAEVSAAVESAPDRWKLAILLAVWCQLRRGEILGLQRRDVDQLHGTISVERTFVAVSGASPVIGPPKTDAGRRLIAIPPNVIEAVELHLSKHVGSAKNAWLFPGAGDSPAVPKTLSLCGRRPGTRSVDRISVSMIFAIRGSLGRRRLVPVPRRSCAAEVTRLRPQPCATSTPRRPAIVFSLTPWERWPPRQLT